VIFVSPGQIDQLNILQATLWGMKSALQSLKKTPDLVLIDGNKAPQGLDIPCRTVVKGDSKHACIAAASVLAKTIRDAAMEEYELEYPGYGFAKHKGYPTERHIEALSRLGLSSIHRLSYAPCQQLTIFTRNG
jgi:ribonuclease HII